MLMCDSDRKRELELQAQQCLLFKEQHQKPLKHLGGRKSNGEGHREL